MGTVMSRLARARKRLHQALTAAFPKGVLKCPAKKLAPDTCLCRW
jgi:hypothetical protein